MVPIDSRNPVFYSWDESQSARGSTEVGSSVYDYLKNMTFDDNIYHLRLFCDGCGGQNKNNHIVHMILFYLLNDSPPHLKDITLFFPVRGHSFLPADRVFGRLEKEIRKKSVITSKDEYQNIFEEFGNVRRLGEDWVLKDLKSLEAHYKKLDGIQSLKRIKFLKKRVRGTYTVEVKTHETYRFESSEKPVPMLKKGKRHPLSLDDLELGQRPLNEKKKKDIKNLLTKQFGEEWFSLDELKWYKELLIDDPNCGIAEDEEMENNDCGCLMDDISGVRI